ncbi:uncharacterized protein LOC143041684 [Oratosquilla oratoria]|uniref:uncharacterized protein LOC143041684 n=1 Tax=Oratosquilla oratoria TaxID=337810 RepID=UPI003F76E631
MTRLSVTNFARARRCALRVALLLKSVFSCCSGTKEDLEDERVLRGEVQTPVPPPSEVKAPKTTTQEVHHKQDVDEDIKGPEGISNVDGHESPSTSETIEVASRRPFRANYDVQFSQGSGGFAETFVVSDKATGSTGVAKVPLKGKACANETEKEIEALKALVHPNIVKLLDVAISEDVAIVVTEYCPGGTLTTTITKKKRTLSGQTSSSSSLAWGARVLSFARQLVAAVAFMHKNGFVHLDLKADNVVLDDKEEVVKVIDFGASARTSNAYKPEMTTVQGTPWHMSPEVLDKTKHPYAGGKADVWSLGCVLYQLSTGHLPYFKELPEGFRGSRKEYYLQSCKRGRPSFKNILPETFSKGQQEALKKILWKMLDAKPKTRATIWQVADMQFP